MGYGKADGSLQFELAVPLEKVAAVRRMLPLYNDDPDALDPYELLPWQAREIAELAGKPIRADLYEFFLQAFEDEPDTRDHQAGLAAH